MWRPFSVVLNVFIGVVLRPCIEDQLSVTERYDFVLTFGVTTVPEKYFALENCSCYGHGDVPAVMPFAVLVSVQ